MHARKKALGLCGPPKCAWEVESDILRQATAKAPPPLPCMREESGTLAQHLSRRDGSRDYAQGCEDLCRLLPGIVSPRLATLPAPLLPAPSWALLH